MLSERPGEGAVSELFDRLAALIPPPRRHRHRYHGVPEHTVPRASKKLWGSALYASLPQTAQPSDGLEQTPCRQIRLQTTYYGFTRLSEGKVVE